MQCRKTALALALASLAAAAHARLPADVQIERLSPTRIAVVWSGALVPAEKLDVGLAAAPGKPVDGATLRDDVAGSAGRVELEHASGVRPYVWIGDNKGNETTLGERVLPLQGGVNFRDLGGYRTDDGRSVRWGRLYRSGVMADLTDSDYAYLQRLGITAICDLRDSRERSHSPTQAGRIARGGRYIAWDYQQDFDMKAFAGAFAMGGDPQETALRLMAAFYRQMPAAFAARYREAFDVLKQGDGLLFNCSAGKDRTGLLAALVLTALGVAPDVVVNDYAMSQRVPSLQRLRTRMDASATQDPGMSALSRLPEPALRALMGTDPMYLSAAFDQIRADHGSIDAYLEQQLGVGAADRARLRALYLEPAPASAGTAAR